MANNIGGSSGIQASIQKRLQEIKAGFLNHLPVRIDEIAHAAAVLAAEPGARDLLSRQAHSLVGSGATFGLPAVTEAARRIEILARSQTSDQDLAPLLPPVIEDLRRAAAQATVTTAAAPTVDSGLDERQRLLYQLEDDADQAAELASLLAAYDYRVVTYADADSFYRAIQERRPDAVLVDVMTSSSLVGGPAVMARLRALEAERWERKPIPCIFLSAGDDFGARLAAVRAGGDSYLLKPVDIGLLVDRLDVLTGRQRPQPLTALIVDDDASAGAHYEAILQMGGFDAKLVTSPFEAVAAIQAHDPDIIITDLVMPDCSGFELSAVLRQHEDLLTLPIVFLTADDTEETARSAVRNGVDALLTKPVDVKQLVETVRARAQRSRLLRGMMVRDSLTGVYNHGMIKDSLVSEVARCRRAGTPLAMAMIDIDHFKSVNDTHGHALGDRVIKGLARLLLQRLRRTDIIGRYGGEEFAVIMPGTTARAAAERLDTLRQQFATIRHGQGDKAFQVTFSVGVAELQPDMTAQALNVLADEVLYQAKRKGRNRVEVV
ncbi:diguanylate cyclase [Nitrospirillum sp. BR 11164]|uniref:diguanylate cyclase n=1 Tax=Nitrospirillum sp. BR 11164 TaxID=3104324 RepID=UPI002AFF8B33|nr:diguanylate cyclase [Nitrospirillum sp. BR 11164]MEA1652381.1 diguanylate cyclase [Nitrospirillum sp. BR 11164]